MTEPHFRIPPYLSVMAAGDDLLVGVLPPRALRIEDVPSYLPGLLAFLSRPRSYAELTEHSRSHTTLRNEELQALMDELAQAGVVCTTEFDPSDRYARHHLYYDLLGLDAANAQRRLREATVGLVGMGGVGSGVAVLLAAAGIGTLVCSDGDRVEVSNLTRQTLYGGAGVGRPKVDIAASRLHALNPEVTVVPVRESIAGGDLLDRHFSACDFVVLSADSPPDVHAWTSDAALRHGFVTSNAGYIEAFGVVGPLIVPGSTACYACLSATGDRQGQDGTAPAELNAYHQAPSFGPLNAVVAAMQANEVIRHLLGLPTETSGCRLLLDSSTYELHRERFERDPTCPRCGGVQPDAAEARRPEPSLADVYVAQRKDASQNAIVLDPLVANLLPGTPGRRVLDIGCGTGEQVVRLAQAGCWVTGTDVSADMLAHAATRVTALELEDRVELHRVARVPKSTIPFDDILCLNVLDHVEDPGPFLADLAACLHPEGRMIISLPHPVKDGGVWRKEMLGGEWRYSEFLLRDYFDEGPVTKSREDPDGEIVIKEIRTFHRTTATWVRLFSDAGLQIVGLWEPSPAAEHEDTLPTLYAKSSRVPYFQVFALSRGSVQALR